MLLMSTQKYSTIFTWIIWELGNIIYINKQNKTTKLSFCIYSYNGITLENGIFVVEESFAVVSGTENSFFFTEIREIILDGQ